VQPVQKLQDLEIIQEVMNNTPVTYNNLQVLQYDPTRTLTLRTAFVKDMNRRFVKLTRVITKAIVEDDCFGLGTSTYAELNSPGYLAFSNLPLDQKIEAFMQWLQTQEDRELLERPVIWGAAGAVVTPWTNKYISSGYEQGVIRARQELKKGGFVLPTIADAGGIEAVMLNVTHLERVAYMFSKTFSELEGITSQMNTQISRILGQGLIDGDSMHNLARKLVATINGTGMGELGITDSLGRFIPAYRRAEMLARTEIIRAHHLANIAEYKSWGALGVTVIAEWSTAGDDRVCVECASYHGNRYTLAAIEHAIPVHPNCRCIAIPIDKRSVNQSEIRDQF